MDDELAAGCDRFNLAEQYDLRALRVLDVVPFEDADQLGFVAMLKVEAA